MFCPDWHGQVARRDTSGTPALGRIYNALKWLRFSRRSARALKPYRGGAPALTDLISGQVQVMFDNVPTSIEFIRAGKLRPLAVTTAARSNVLPDLPTVADFVPGYEASAWYGVGVPKGTPEAIIGKLNKETNAILADPKARARFDELGASLIAGSPAEFGQLVADETEKWAKVVKFSGARPD